MTAKQTNIVALNPEIPLAPSRLALALPANLEFEPWCAIGVALGRSHTRAQWLIGDWWAFGQHRYGERAALVREGELGLSFHTCANYASVAKSFKTSRRREHLSFAHHAEVAGLDAAEADSLLDYCTLPDGRCRTLQELRDEKHERRLEARQRDKEAARSMVQSKPAEARATEYDRITTWEAPPRRTDAHTTSITAPERVQRPTVAPNLVERARAVYAVLSPEQQVDFIVEKLAERSPEEQLEVIAEAAADLGYRLVDGTGQ